MLSVTDDFNKAFKEPNRRLFLRLKMNGRIYEKERINNFDYVSGSFAGETYAIGSTFANTIKIEFCEVIEGLKELDEIQVEIGIQTYDADIPMAVSYPFRMGSAKIGKAQLIKYRPNEFEFVKLGTFYISGRVDPDRNENKTTVEAMDGFIFMGGLYESKLNYPAQIRDVALEIANLSGMKINTTSFGRLSTTRIARMTGYTYRQAIGLIAQFEANFVRFDRSGLLDIRGLEDPKFEVTPNEYFMKGLVKSELMYRIGGISCKVDVPNGDSVETTILQAGSKTGAQIALENNVMTQTLLNSIYQKIKEINYYPVELKWRGNPALEAGDWVTLRDRKGVKFKTPNLSYNLRFNGGLTADTRVDSNGSSESTYAYKGPLAQRLDELDARVDAAGKNNVYEGIDPPKYPKEGDIWFKPNGPDKEIWVYKKIGIDKYAWVMQTSTALDETIKEQIENSTPKDEIVKTINLSNELDGKEWLKIEGAKIWLTKETKIDKAIITSAMIESVDAGTINVGTLNGANVNVINLNASSISTGIAKGPSLSINFDTGNVLFEKGLIKRSDDKFKIDITRGEIESYDSGGGFTLKSGEILLSDRSFWNSGVSEFGRISWQWGLGAGIRQSGLAIQGTSAFALLTKNFENVVMVNRAKGSGVYTGSNGTSLNLNSEGTLSLRGGALKTGTIFNAVAGIIIGTGGSGNEISLDGQAIEINGRTSISGGLNVSGAKNAIHVTRDGVRATPAEEGTESWLFDSSWLKDVTTDENCEKVIPIDDLFYDVATTEMAYNVEIYAYSNANFWVTDRLTHSFKVHSSVPNAKFGWRIIAKRRGFESERLFKQTDYKNEKIEEIWREDTWKKTTRPI